MQEASRECLVFVHAFAHPSGVAFIPQPLSLQLVYGNMREPEWHRRRLLLPFVVDEKKTRIWGSVVLVLWFVVVDVWLEHNRW